MGRKAEVKQPAPPKKSAKELWLESYQEERRRLAGEGYREQSCVISVAKANVCALLVTAPFIALFALLYWLRWQGSQALSPRVENMLLLAALLFLTIPIHELLHGLGWSLGCRRGWRSIGFGIMWSSLTPYCHCREPLGRRPYLVGVLTPFLALGVGISLASLFIQSWLLLLLGLLNLLMAGGDLTIALLLIRHPRALILDHPSECGFVAFRKPRTVIGLKNPPA